MEYTAKKNLSCVGTNREVKVGDIIMLQQVATVLKISPSYAKELLLELERREFLSYEEGNEGKSSGWHFTEQGVLELSKK